MDDQNTTEIQEEKREGGKYANWCRTKGHDADCNCVYPHPSTIIPMRGAAPGSRPMPRDNK